MLRWDDEIPEKIVGGTKFTTGLRIEGTSRGIILFCYDICLLSITAHHITTVWDRLGERTPALMVNKNTTPEV